MSMSESLFRSLVSALGVTPEQVTNAINLALSELETLKQEREAIKRGAGQMVAHFNLRLTAQDERMGRIENCLIEIASSVEAWRAIDELKSHGKVIEHERHTG